MEKRFTSALWILTAFWGQVAVSGLDCSQALLTRDQQIEQLSQKYRAGESLVGEAHQYSEILRQPGVTVDTPLKELRELAGRLFEFARRGLAAQVGKYGAYDVNSRSEALGELERKWIHSDSVSYRLVLDHALRVSTILTPREKRKIREIDIKLNQNYISQFLGVFPNVLLLPTFSDSIGLTTFNRLLGEGIFPLGVVADPTEVDGEVFFPDKFFDHDIFHAIEMEYAYGNGYAPRLKELGVFYRELHPKLSSEKKLLLDFSLFYASHEQSLSIVDFLDDGQDVVKTIESFHRDNTETLMKQIKIDDFYGAWVPASYKESDHSVAEFITRSFNELSIFLEKFQSRLLPQGH